MPLLPSAQEPEPKIENAGGRWTYHAARDKFSDALHAIFELKATESITDGIASGFPTFVILCGGTAKSPQWINSKLLSPVVLGRPERGRARPDVLDVLFRSDKLRRTWTLECIIAEGFRTLFVDKWATKQLLGSTDVRMQFRDASGHAQVALFSPAGLDRDKLVGACGAVFK